MRQRKGRALNNLLLLDKPSGITSNKALQKVKRLFKAAKAGHTGSLDPLATGLLIICFGKTTKISQFLLNADKYYEVAIKLGVVTDTGDADGTIIDVNDASLISANEIEQRLTNLTGVIEQVPPMYSALKHQGSRLYKLARKGIEVQRAARKVEIFSFKFIQKDKSIARFTIHCSKGTYIRTLIEDLGRKLGCGAHVLELRRTALGPFKTPKMFTINELEERANQYQTTLDETLISAEMALKDWPAIILEAEQMQSIQHGHPIWIEGTPKNECIRIYDANEKFYGVGALLDDGRIAPKSLS